MKIAETQNKKTLFWKDIFLLDNHINIKLLSKQLAMESIVHAPALKELINRCMSITNDQPNMIEVEDPVIILGDIHGQFYDLLKILSHTTILKDCPQTTKLIFLGDYVDRGINSIEVMILLMALKIQFSSNVILLRGNHESKIMTEQYNFREECCSKYSQQIYQLILSVFDTLPIICLVNREYFCVHGGITDRIKDIKKINNIQRRKEIPLYNSAICDFIWSDPVDRENGQLKDTTKFNQSRDCSIVYGIELVSIFLQANRLTTIIRGHQVFLEGYKMHLWNGDDQPPPVITVFSAPNYCGTCGNKGAVVKIQNNIVKIRQFKEQQPEKYKFLAKFDVFSWTLPQIMVNVRDIVIEIMDILVQNQIPELHQASTDQRMEAFVQYAYDRKLIDRPKKIQLNLNIKPKIHTAEEDRNYLFNRSHEYFAEFEKAPKH